MEFAGIAPVTYDSVMNQMNREDVLARPESASKDQVRKVARELRSEIGADARQAASHVIAKHVMDLVAMQNALRDGGVVFCYVGAGDEVETLQLLEGLLQAGVRMCVPKMKGKPSKKTAGNMKAVEVTDLSVLKENEFGILEPSKGAAFRGHPAVTITPGVGFTRGGCRLGQGGGYYDKYFKQHPLTVRVGLAFECQLFENLPGGAAGWDEKVDMVVTEKAVYQRDEVAVEEDDLWEQT